MEYIELNNGVKMPMLGFGTFLNNGDECEKSVCSAIKAGYRLIDTAEAYGNEEQVGNGIKLSGIDRKELFIVTKVNFRSYENARENVLSSLEKLNTNYLDLVLLHWPLCLLKHGLISGVLKDVKFSIVHMAISSLSIASRRRFRVRKSEDFTFSALHPHAAAISLTLSPYQ